MRSTDILKTGFSGACVRRSGVALCALLAGCVTTVPNSYTMTAPAPTAQLPSPPSIGQAQQPASSGDPSPIRMVASSDVSTVPAPPPPVRSARQNACSDLVSGTETVADRVPAHAPAAVQQAAESPAAEAAAAAADIPDPASGDPTKSDSPVVAPAKSTATSNDLGQKIAARSAELSRADTADKQAEKEAEAGRTARAAALYAADWKATPNDWVAAAKAVELWVRVGDYLSAEVLLKAVIDKAGSVDQQPLADQAETLDKKLNLSAGASAQAERLWKRTFALEPEGHYAEAIALLHRLQAFDPTAPGYYIREASLFAHCEDGPHAAEAIARGSAAGVSFSGRWAPARDPSLVRLWPNPQFQEAIRDTLGEAAVEDFEEHLTAR